MKKFYLIVACLCIFGFAVLPAQAFTANSLTITLGPNGDAQADMQYSLSFIEQAAVFVHIANPSAELEKALNDNFNKPVTVLNADSSSADVVIPSFAAISTSDGQTMMTTPSLSFRTRRGGNETLLVCTARFSGFRPRGNNDRVPRRVPGDL